MKLFGGLKKLFVSPKVVECQMCGVSGDKSTMLWGYSFWFCSPDHRDDYWSVGDRFRSLKH